MNKVLIILFLISILFLLLYCNNTIDKLQISCNITNNYEQQLYDNLMNNFKNIFSNGNRNAGGPQFYNYIVNTIKPTFEDFKIYNKFYCGVSGSPIDPNRKNSYDNIVIDDVSGKQMVGKYFRCCSPCVCDVIKYAKSEEHTYDGNKIYVLTINDPCINQTEIPNNVDSYICNDDKTSNGEHTNTGRLIFALLHDAEIYNKNKHSYIIEENNKLCNERNKTDPNNLKSGMGDIFIKIASIGKLIEPLTIENKHNIDMLNIYGQTLQKCKTGEDPGSWDPKGYCSELDDGVHQICFDVKDETSDFSSETGQSDWSEDRVGNHHCMCLGAWALYKAKNKGNNNELVCESIPEIALSTDYVSKWNTWNGNELEHQIINGVDSLVEQCYNKGNYNSKQYLKNLYNTLRNYYNSNYNSNYWDSII